MDSNYDTFSGFFGKDFGKKDFPPDPKTVNKAKINKMLSLK